MSDAARQIPLALVIGVLVIVGLRRRSVASWRELLARLSVLLWPPLSAFAHSSRPGLARAWWTFRVLVMVSAGLFLVFVMWRTGLHYDGWQSTTGRP